MNPFDFDDNDGGNGSAATLELPTLANLGKVRAYLEDEADLAETGGALDDEQRRLIGSLIALVEGLCELTQWSRGTLLDRIGCPAQSADDLIDMDRKRLADCETFVGLVHQMTQLVDVPLDRRAVVTECSRLLKATRQDAKGLERILRAGDFSPMDYISLGEVSTAAEVARERNGAARTDADEGENAYDAAPTTHLSLTRVDLYVRDKRELLGETVSDRITAHLLTCPGCRASVDLRRARTAD